MNKCTLRDITIESIVPVEYLKKTSPEKLKTALDEIGFKDTLPDEGVVFILYKKGDEKFLVQVARKDEVSSKNLPGYEWVVSDRYVVKYVPEDYVPSEAKAAETEKPSEATITESIAEVETPAIEAAGELPATPKRKFSIRAIVVSVLLMMLILIFTAGCDSKENDIRDRVKKEISERRAQTERIVEMIKQNEEYVKPFEHDCSGDAFWNSLAKEGELAVPALIEELKCSKHGHKAWDALVRIGEPAVPALIEALEHKNPAVRYRTAIILGKIKDPRAEASLRKASNNNNNSKGMRIKAKEALKAMPNYVNPLVLAVKKVGIAVKKVGIGIFTVIIVAVAFGVIWRILFPLSWHLMLLKRFHSRRTEETLAKIGTPAVGQLIGLLNSKNKASRISAARILGMIRASEAVPVLGNALNARNASINSDTADAFIISLGEIGGEHAGRTLVEILKKHNFQKKEVVDSLVKIGRLALDGILEILQDDKAVGFAYYTAAVDIAKKMRATEAIPYLVRILQLPEPYVRVPEALEELGWKPKSEAEKLTVLAAREDWNGLVKHGAPAIQIIIRKLKSKKLFGTDKDKACSALAKIGEPVMDPLKELLNGDDRELRILAIQVLGEIGSVESVSALNKLSKNSDTGISEAAIRALGAKGDVAMLSLFVEILSNAIKSGKKDYSVRKHSAMEEIVKIGKPAIPPLLSDLKNDDISVRQAAALALDRLGWDRGTSRELSLYAIAKFDTVGIRKIAKNSKEETAMVKALDRFAEKIEGRKESHQTVLNTTIPKVLAVSRTSGEFKIYLSLSSKLAGSDMTLSDFLAFLAREISRVAASETEIQAMAQDFEGLLHRLSDNGLTKIFPWFCGITEKVADSQDELMQAFDLLDSFFGRLSEKGINPSLAFEYGLHRLYKVSSLDKLKEYLTENPNLDEKELVSWLIEAAADVMKVKTWNAGERDSESVSMRDIEEIVRIKAESDLSHPLQMLELTASAATEGVADKLIEVFEAIQDMIRERYKLLKRLHGVEEGTDSGWLKETDPDFKKNETLSAYVLERFGKIPFAEGGQAKAKMVGFLSNVAADSDNYTVYQRQAAVMALLDIGGATAERAAQKAMTQDSNMLSREVRLPETCSRKYAIKRVANDLAWIVGKERMAREYSGVEETIGYLFSQNPGFIDFLWAYPLRLFFLESKKEINPFVVLLGDFRKFWFHLLAVIHYRMQLPYGVWQEIGRSVEVEDEGSPIDMGIAVELFKNRSLVASVIRHEYLHYKGTLSEGEVLLRQVNYLKAIIAETGIDMSKPERAEFERGIAQMIRDIGILPLGYYIIGEMDSGYRDILNKNIVASYGPDGMSKTDIRMTADKVIQKIEEVIPLLNQDVKIERIRNPEATAYQPFTNENKEKIRQLVMRAKSVENTLSASRFNEILQEDKDFLSKWEEYRAGGGASALAGYRPTTLHSINPFAIVLGVAGLASIFNVVRDFVFVHPILLTGLVVGIGVAILIIRWISHIGKVKEVHLVAYKITRTYQDPPVLPDKWTMVEDVWVTPGSDEARSFAEKYTYGELGADEYGREKKEE